MENEKSYFQAKFGNFKKQRIRQCRKESDAKFNSVRFEKNGPTSSSEAKVMVVLSLNSESGFLARCWKGGGSVFLDRVGFRDIVTEPPK